MLILSRFYQFTRSTGRVSENRRWVLSPSIPIGGKEDIRDCGPGERWVRREIRGGRDSAEEDEEVPKGAQKAFSLCIFHREGPR